jgi:hypothetical protein
MVELVQVLGALARLSPPTVASCKLLVDSIERLWSEGKHKR